MRALCWCRWRSKACGPLPKERCVPAHPRRYVKRCATLDVTSKDDAQGAVVLTRQAGKNRLLQKLLSEDGISTFELPLVESVPGAHVASLPQTLRQQHFVWVAITSPEAAIVFVDGWQKADKPAVNVAAVGAGTAKIITAEASGDLPVSFIPTRANAETLASELPLTPAPDGSCTVLYPASALAPGTLQNGLEARGFHVVRLDTYSTAPVTAVPQHVLETALACAVIAVASPSALRAWVNLVGLQQACKIPTACIGSTTGRAALEVGLHRELLFWSENPAIPGFVKSIKQALATTCAALQM